MSLPRIEDTDLPLVAAFAREQTIQDVFLWRLQRSGVVVETKTGPQASRLLKEYGASVHRMLGLVRALNLTPASRTAPKAPDLVALMARLAGETK
jgi:hypothetical protein